MKVGQTQFKRTANLFLTIALMTGAISIPGMAQTAPALSQKDAQALLKAATTAKDHQELAAHYRERASHLIAESQRFAKQAEFMDTQSKRGGSCACAAPYRYLSNEYAKEEREAEESAVQQERLAQR